MECSFFIFPDVGLVISKLGTRPSHIDMLKNMGFSEIEIKKIIRDVPRGYCKDGFVAIYQEYEIDKPGYILEVKPENESLIQTYLPDLKQLLNLNNDTPIYMGVKVGKIGDVWELLRKTDFTKILNLS